MADFMTLKAKLSLDSSEYEKGLDKSEKRAKGLGSRLAGGAKALAKGFAVVGAAAAGGVAVLTKSAVDAYAEYEQLAGGIRKLYGDATDEMLAFADQAYITSGMSANAYIRNVTGFSAALLNSVEGDSKEAARIADMAMQDISDNANTFGKYTAEELAGVYQALAKGQYQTLDNLMLGYGGSKEGMQQLIDHANELAKAQGMAGDLAIDSYADIVEAIHLVQGEMNITGTTANEAAGTIEGSLNMTKAAWQNLVAGFANPDSDIGLLVENVVTSAGHAAENLVPAIMRAVEGIGTGLSTVLPQVLSSIPAVVKDIGVPLLKTGAEFALSIGKGIAGALPDLIGVVTGLIGDLTSSIDGALPGMIERGLSGLTQFSEILRSSAGSLVDAGMDLIMNIAQGLADSMPALIAQVPTIVTNIAGVINDNAPKILKTGLTIIKTLALGLIKAIPTLVANIPKILQAIWNVFTAFNWLALGGQLITAIGNGVKALGESLPGIMKGLGEKALNAFKNINWAGVGRTVINLIGNAIKGLISLPGTILKRAASLGMKAFTGIAWGNVGKTVLQGIARGITAAISLVTTAVRKVINKIKSYFPFNIGKIFSGWVPKISLKTNKSGDSATTSSSTSKDYFAKAMAQPYMFKRPTEFYAGEAGDEMLYGKSALINDIRTAVGGTEAMGQNVTIYNTITVEGAESPEDFAERLVRKMKLDMRAI